MKQLFTEFCRKESISHKEYPRPQFERSSYINLNGAWKYAVTSSEEFPDKYDGEIIIPFSMESPLSGVNRQLQPNEYLHYERTVCLDEDFCKGRILINFGAIDEQCKIYINNTLVATNDNGYLPIQVEVPLSQIGAQFVIRVVCWDNSDESETLIGKQRLKSGGIWYTAQSGIWQTVWMESVANDYIDSVKYDVDIDDGTVTFSFETIGKVEQIKGSISLPSGKVQTFGTTGRVSVKLEELKLWSPDDPYLYDVEFDCESEKIKSYFAMRKFSYSLVNGYQRLMLNNSPIFMNGLLDQGYYPDGLLTPPSDEAMLNDIIVSKKLGFNMLRKHIKIEPLRWYYHCDKVGMLVWQDMVNGGNKYDFWTTIGSQFFTNSIADNEKNQHKFGRRDKGVMTQHNEQLKQMIELLYNCPCICVWVPFNEGWGQFDALSACEQVRMLDSSRLIDHASGWHDQGGGDFKSVHIYFRKVRLPMDSDRVVALTEFGGYSFHLSEHSYSEKVFGYKVLKTKDKLQSAYDKMFKRDVIDNVAKGLSATVYTQLTDVEEEVNGMLTYDRKVIKFDEKRIKELNEQLYETFEKEVIMK